MRARFEKLRAEILVPYAEQLREHLSMLVDDLPRVDRVTARAKATDRFLEKAERVSEDGEPKYAEPLREIQDLVGARIVTYYLSDVEPIAACINKHLRAVEDRDVRPESDREFGYVGKHLVLFFPTDFQAHDDAPKVFELQIKTLFQHAWSEAEHDLGYKPDAPLTAEEKRQIAFTAAQSWGADRIFDELFRGQGD